MKNKTQKPLFIALFSAIAILLAAPLIYIINIRASAYPYNTTIDYHYDFDGTDAKLIDLYLKDGKCNLPILHDANYSLFLKIDISTTFIGQFF